MSDKYKPVIGIVGPCAAGKTTLISGLKQYGFKGRHIAQEHSYVPDMWQRLVNPDILIYLDVSYPVTIQRRKLNWHIGEYNKQVDRLRHARHSSNLYINTDNQTPQEVLNKAFAFITFYK